jgi:hypothetical protein
MVELKVAETVEEYEQVAGSGRDPSGQLPMEAGRPTGAGEPELQLSD